jgi:hypothetical protein
MTGLLLAISKIARKIAEVPKVKIHVTCTSAHDALSVSICSAMAN